MSDRPIVIKNNPEIGLMREAGKINALVLTTIRDMIRPGIATEDLDAVAEQIIREHGGIPAFKGYPGPYPYPATLNVSINNLTNRANYTGFSGVMTSPYFLQATSVANPRQVDFSVRFGF